MSKRVPPPPAELQGKPNPRRPSRISLGLSSVSLLAWVAFLAAVALRMI